MPRLKLQPQRSYPFRTTLKVRSTDLNYGGHLGHDTLLSLVQEARVDWLNSHGWQELDCAGVGLIMGDAAVVYQGEAFAGQRLLIEVAATEPTRSGFRLCYRLTRTDGEDQADNAIALVETGMVCFDYQRRCATSLPAAVAAVCREKGNHDRC